MVERDPELDKIETRSASLDQIGEQSSEAPRVDGFTYEVRFKNLSPKQAQLIFWEYVFKEIANPEQVTRHRFVCAVKIKADQDKLLQVFTTLGPTAVIDVKNMARGSEKKIDGSVVIDRIEFEDGSVWQRQDWQLDAAKLALTKDRDRTGVCRNF